MGYNRAETESALIAAVGRLIEKGGIGAIGVNAIAREAGVNKTLIYRYFEGLDGLYRAFANSTSIWPSLEEIVGDVPARVEEISWQSATVELLMNYAASLRARPLTLDILAWECVSRNALTIALEEVRERRSMEIFDVMFAAGYAPAVDVRAPLALLSGAINYLTVRSRDIRIFGGAEVGSDHFWEEELRDALAAMIGGLS